MKKFILTLCVLAFIGIIIFAQKKFIDDADFSLNIENNNISETELFATIAGIKTADKLTLPLAGSAPETNTKHTIPIDEIRRGCFKQDCIPSVDRTDFVLPADLDGILDPDSLGIALSYKGENRFYPFPMLETHELVNDTVAGDPVLISYCPLCGTGIVFSRVVDGETAEFGVSGMLWQSNLLMYNRAEKLQDRNLWSQVLGQAVVGNRAGEKLSLIPSDIVKFSVWKDSHPQDLVLTTGTPRDPYNGEYYAVAQSFSPDFNPKAANLPPDTYVYGIVVESQPAAVTKDSLKPGDNVYLISGKKINFILKDSGTVLIVDEEGELIDDVEGFWFSWQSAHPDTILLSN